MKKKSFEHNILYVILVIGFVFLRTGLTKVIGGTFVDGLKKTLTHFASENPFPFVKTFLESTAIPNTELFAYLTMWGEVYVGCSLVLSVAYLLMKKSLTKITFILLSTGLLVAIFLNTTFLLSAGWTSSSTESVNLVLLSVGVISLVYVVRTFSHVLKD